MRAVVGLIGAGLMLAAAPARAQQEAAGPFVCAMGDSEGVLTANDDGTEYSGTFMLAGDYAGMETQPREATVLRQKYDSWNTVYENDDMTMVVSGDRAQIYGAFGTSTCVAETPNPPGAGDDAGRIVSGEGQRWSEWDASGTAITWGGNVRSGPGEDFSRLIGVPLGRSVEVLAVADRYWLDEYPWFKVRLANGTVGYIAGGLLCSREDAAGMYNARNCEG